MLSYEITDIRTKLSLIEQIDIGEIVDRRKHIICLIEFQLGNGLNQ